MDALLQEENALRTHVEEEVEDAEVRQETVFLPVDLIVGAGLEVSIGQRMLGVDDFAEVFER